MNAAFRFLPLLARDAVGLAALHGVLLCLACVAFVREQIVRYRAGHGGIVLTITRGAQSMSTLYVFYGASTLVFALAVQISEAAQGYKVWIVTLDYAVLTYLCFFNLTFRNWILARAGDIRKESR